MATDLLYGLYERSLVNQLYFIKEVAASLSPVRLSRLAKSESYREYGFTHCKAMMLPLFKTKEKFCLWTKLGSFTLSVALKF